MFRHPIPLYRHGLPLTATLAMLACGHLAAADTAPLSVTDQQALLQRLDALESQVHDLASMKPVSANPLAGLSFGVYGEVKYGLQQNPDANGAWQSGFDNARLTLMPSYRISDSILFTSEIEFEHSGIANANDDKLGGTAEVEQAYLDITFNEHLHWRPPGVDLVPFGWTNLEHEPTLFYSVNRPELANGLIPTTWAEGSTSIHGILAGPVSYQFQISTSLVDDGGNVRDVTNAKTPADPLGYPAGVDGHNGLGLARSTTGDFAQESDALGYALRLAYDVPAVHGLAGSTSVYWTPNIEPRGAYASDVNNVKLGGLGRCALTMADTEVRYRPDAMGIEVRAEGVIAHFSNPANLRANNDGDPEDNVGRTMWGASAEVAWHCRPAAGWELVPFYRYTKEVLQTAGVEGLDANAPTGAGRIQYHTIGIAAFPTPQVVLKLDYQAVRDASHDGARSDHVLGGVGFFF